MVFSTELNKLKEDVRATYKPKFEALLKERAEKMAEADKLNKEARELLNKARGIEYEARTAYFEEAAKLEHELAREMGRVEREYVLKKEAEAKASGDSTKRRAHVLTGDPFIDIMLSLFGGEFDTKPDEKKDEACKTEEKCTTKESDPLTESILNMVDDVCSILAGKHIEKDADKKEEKTCDCGCNCHCEEADATQENDLSDEDKLKFFRENIEKLTPIAKAYYGLTDARVVNTRADHSCGYCGVVIPAQSKAIASVGLYIDDKTLADLYDDDEEILENNGEFTLKGFYAGEKKFSRKRIWLCLDDAYNLLRDALTDTDFK